MRRKLQVALLAAVRAGAPWPGSGEIDIMEDINGHGTVLQLHDCTGNPAQVWVDGGNGTLRNPQSGRCPDSTGGATGNGTRLQIWDCNGSGAQTFRKA